MTSGKSPNHSEHQFPDLLNGAEACLAYIAGYLGHPVRELMERALETQRIAATLSRMKKAEEVHFSFMGLVYLHWGPRR